MEEHVKSSGFEFLKAEGNDHLAWRNSLIEANRELEEIIRIFVWRRECLIQSSWGSAGSTLLSREGL